MSQRFTFAKVFNGEFAVYRREGFELQLVFVVEAAEENLRAALPFMNDDTTREELLSVCKAAAMRRQSDELFAEVNYAHHKRALSRLIGGSVSISSELPILNRVDGDFAYVQWSRGGECEIPASVICLPEEEA